MSCGGNDWQDRESRYERELDEYLANISTEDLEKALKRRKERVIQEKLKQYEAELRGSK